MLVGQYTSQVSEKGRVALPKKFRKELGEQVVLARWYETCLVVVAGEVWKKILDSISGGQVVTRPARETDRFLLAGAFEIELDSQGRFVVPRALREYAKLEGEVVFIGLGDRVEIWDNDLWKEHEREVLEKAGELAEVLFKQRSKKE